MTVMIAGVSEHFQQELCQTLGEGIPRPCCLLLNPFAVCIAAAGFALFTARSKLCCVLLSEVLLCQLQQQPSGTAQQIISHCVGKPWWVLGVYQNSRSDQENSWEKHPLEAVWRSQALSQEVRKVKLLEAGTISKGTALFCSLCSHTLAAVGNEASSDLVRQTLGTCAYSRGVIANALQVAQSSIGTCWYSACLPWHCREEHGDRPR